MSCSVCACLLHSSKIDCAKSRSLNLNVVAKERNVSLHDACLTRVLFAQPMTVYDYDELWAAAEEAKTMDDVCTSHQKDYDSDEEDAFGNNVLMMEAQDASSSIVRMPDGDIHVCDSSCQYAIVKRDGNLVCPYSSKVISHVAVERSDFSTGRSTWSADPDMQSSSNGTACVWRKKVDKLAASKQAHRMSAHINDSEMPVARIQQRARTAVGVKKGALCVDETSNPDAPAKRARVSKKHIQSSDQMHNLIQEASEIFSRLIGGNQKMVTFAPPKSKPAAVVDQRLMNSNFLFESALKKYINQCKEGNVFPCIDEIHNISLAVESIVRAAKLKHAEATQKDNSKYTSVQFKGIVSRLAVALWRGACQTPYMSKARRGGDSFRPFCVGVYYSLKRGLTLSDGTILVPACEGLSGVFPHPKEIALNPTMKTLHASSHKGLCSIHRCLASISNEKQHLVFASALQLVSELSKIC